MTDNWETIVARWRQEEKECLAPPGMVEELLQTIEARHRRTYVRRTAALAVLGIAAVALWLATAPDRPDKEIPPAEFRAIASDPAGPCTSPGSCLPGTSTPGLDDIRLALSPLEQAGIDSP